nr:hypothetical protein [uncultured Capnocytophaga sp.]
MEIRKHIIKLFALNYIVPFAGKTRSFTRSANIILPLILIGGLIVCAELYSWLYVVLPLLAVACFFGFGYFHFCPLTDKDFSLLDDTQHWQYEAFQRRVTSEPKSYNACWVVWVNPLAIALVLLFTLIL